MLAPKTTVSTASPLDLNIEKQSLWVESKPQEDKLWKWDEANSIGLNFEKRKKHTKKNRRKRSMCTYMWLQSELTYVAIFINTDDGGKKQIYQYCWQQGENSSQYLS